MSTNFFVIISYCSQISEKYKQDFKIREGCFSQFYAALRLLKKIGINSIFESISIFKRMIQFFIVKMSVIYLFVFMNLFKVLITVIKVHACIRDIFIKVLPIEFDIPQYLKIKKKKTHADLILAKKRKIYTFWLKLGCVRVNLDSFFF